MRYLVLVFLLFIASLYAQSMEMKPYLQTPTATSMYVCWFTSSSDVSIVHYGTTSSLGQISNGNEHIFNSGMKWHYVKLQNLNPNTQYYYQCISGSQISDIYSFTTAPNPGTADGHLRIIFMGDTQYEPPPVVTNVGGMVEAIQSKMLELYGDDWKQKINLICHSGDVVEWTGLPDPLNPFIQQYFLPFSPFSANIPSMIAPGNHDFDNADINVLYDLLKTEEICGPQGNGYYAFDLANSKFIFLNANGQPVGQGDTQLAWLDSQLNIANGNNDIDFVFTIAHQCGHSEIVPQHDTPWTEYSVIPRLAAIPKPALLVDGHSHDYERGTHPTSRLRLLTDGGGGADLERWGQEPPEDYPEIHIALDYWMYTVVDIDLVSHSYEAKTYSLGNEDVPLDNVEIDGWTQSTASYSYNVHADAANCQIGGQIKLISSSQIPMNSADLMSSQFQISTNPAFTSTIQDISRNWEDIYEDTGPPLYSPINWNEGIDLKRYTIPNGVIQTGQVYFWRVRYRNQNADWGNWSNTGQFTNASSSFEANFAYNPSLNSNNIILFTDTSVGEPTSWAWDFDGNGTIDSRQRDPYWIYNTIGNYSVTLTVRINGIQYKITKDISINNIVLPAPVNLRIIVFQYNVILTWDSVLGATSYRVQVYNDPNDLHEINTFYTMNPEIMLNCLEMGRSKYFRVVALE